MTNEKRHSPSLRKIEFRFASWTELQRAMTFLLTREIPFEYLGRRSDVTSSYVHGIRVEMSPPLVASFDAFLRGQSISCVVG